MKKLITTLALVAGLLFGGLAIAPAAQADGINTCGGITGIPCDPEPCGGITGTPCPEPSTSCGLNAGPCPTGGLTTCATEPAASPSPGLAKKVDRLQRVADKRAAKIKELRAKLRALR
jgi:hypothetical protein